ncbi:MAG: hypothetical protein ACOZF0_02200 [Thermodesulfobacteriota bacterium]
MTDVIRLQYQKRPSAVIALLKALWGIRRRYDILTDQAEICAVWKKATMMPEHRKVFMEICGLQADLSNDHPMDIIYPWTLVFPLVIRVLGHAEAPLTIFRSVTTKARIVQSRKIGANGEMQAVCRLGDRRLVEKGLEADVLQSIELSDGIAWECRQTFFYKGRFGEPDKPCSLNVMPAIPDAPPIGEWFLPSGRGFRFADISGDSNGIHYSRTYARMLGFERDFAQPMRILSKALEFVPSTGNEPSASGKLEKPDPAGDKAANGQPDGGWNNCHSLDIAFKGPVYYNSRVEVRGASFHDGYRFDVYAGQNPRPCICAWLQ